MSVAGRGCRTAYPKHEYNQFSDLVIVAYCVEEDEAGSQGKASLARLLKSSQGHLYAV